MMSSFCLIMGKEKIQGNVRRVAFNDSLIVGWISVQ